MSRSLVQQLAEEAGMEFNEYLEDQVYESVCDAACVKCRYTEVECVEPDGYRDCPECRGKNSLKSTLLLMGMI